MPVADWWAQASGAAASNATPTSSRPETPVAVSPRSASGSYAVGPEGLQAAEVASVTAAEFTPRVTAAEFTPGQMYQSYGYMAQDGFNMAQDAYAAQEAYVAQDAYAAQTYVAGLHTPTQTPPYINTTPVHTPTHT